jgi:signal transduction histidine kinase
LKNESTHPLTLSFIDAQIESLFKRHYDGTNRIFFRIGIILSCVGWSILYSGIYLSHRNVFLPALITLIGVLLIPFIIVLGLSYSTRYSTLTHNLTAYCNFAAACVCIYVAIYLIKDVTFLCSGIICICFFCYFILRIRFKISVLITFLYALIGQVCVIVSRNFIESEIFTSSSGIWLGFIIAMIAGYFFEKTNRNLFVQYSVIEQQQEELVSERNKLKQSLDNLKSTQAQLIQSEKMASLGELTAGIAHEIQNPLNFINNFAEVSIELEEEMLKELADNNVEQTRVLSSHIGDNLQKIIFHGKRADSIVKNMLQHSRKSSGQKESIDLNALVNEYLSLSYHGLRAKDKSFNTTIKYDFDSSIDKVQVLPQDIGRVLLNLFNNAFYSVSQKKTEANDTYQPAVNVKTIKSGNIVKIFIRDNGIGIPEKTRNKIFQPFFTTKPPGEGTGLGLSMSLDIITKAHGGDISVNSEQGEYAEFEISLPL